MDSTAITARHRLGVCTLTVELDAGQETVWRHLVDPALLVTWSPVVPDRALDAAGPATSQEADGTPVVDATVIEARAPWFLEHRWGPDTLTWQLAPSGGRTLLNLGHQLTEGTQAPDMAAGWHLCLDVLARRLCGEDAPRLVGPAALVHGWQALRDDYAAQFTTE